MSEAPSGLEPDIETRTTRGSLIMAASPSFDIVSKVDRQEVDNAFHQTEKELSTRFDFRGTGTTIAKSGEEGVTITSETEERVAAALDVFKEKLVKRNISLKSLDAGEPRQSGKTYRIDCKVVEGIETDKAKVISKKIRDEGPKGVQAQIQGDQLRVTGKKRDDLQAVIALLKQEDFGVALQFTNYR
jgi:cyclic-di-GMP-binding protein